MGFDADSYRWKFWKRIENLFSRFQFKIFYMDEEYLWRRKSKLLKLAALKHYILEFLEERCKLDLYKLRRKIQKINQQAYLGIGYGSNSWKWSPFTDDFPHHEMIDHDKESIEKLKKYCPEYALPWIKSFQYYSKKNKYLELSY